MICIKLFSVEIYLLACLHQGLFGTLINMVVPCILAMVVLAAG